MYAREFHMNVDDMREITDYPPGLIGGRMNIAPRVCCHTHILAVCVG